MLPLSNEIQISKKSFEDQVRFLILRYPVNLIKVAEEASKFVGRPVPLNEIERIYQKFRKSQNKDVNLWVACNLSQEILYGSQQRLAKLEAMFQQWDGREVAKSSLCCGAPVSEHYIGESHYYRCLKCDTTCNVQEIRRLELEKLKLAILKDIRTENLFLMKFAKDMGFTGKQPETVTKNSNYVFVQTNQAQQAGASVPIDASVGQKIDNMSPMERERFIKSLEKLADTPAEQVVAFEESKSEQNGSKPAGQ